MERSITLMVCALLLGILVLVILAVNAQESTQAFTMGFGAIFGLCSIAFTQHLDARSSLLNNRSERLQEARGMARALASEIAIFGSVLKVKAIMLRVEGGDSSDIIDPDNLLGYIQLPSRAVFEANAHRISLLEVIEDFGKFSEDEERLVEGVVGFYEGAADFRSAVADSKLQNRKVTQKQLFAIQSQLETTADFAIQLSNQLRKLVRLSQIKPVPGEL